MYRARKYIFIISIIFILAFFSGCNSKNENPTTGQKIKIFVSILPQKYFAQKIGGNMVDVYVMVRPGQNPHSYEPTPKQMVELSDTSLYYAIGVNFEQVWLDRMAVQNPGMKIIRTQQGINLREIEKHSHSGHNGEEHGEESLDPHIWLDPNLAVIQGRNMAEGLISILPDRKGEIETNLNEFIGEMTALDSSIKAEFKDIKHKTFIVFHPTWGYFADRYGLEQVSIEQEGKEPSAKHLAEIIKLAEKKDIKVVFVQEQFSKTYAQSIADEIGAKVISFDPLAEDYANNLLKVAKKMAEYFR